jgi:hypothetical protein
MVKFFRLSSIVLITIFALAISSTNAIANPKSQLLYAGVILFDGTIGFSATDNFIVEKGVTGQYFIHVGERVQCNHQGSMQAADDLC